MYTRVYPRGIDSFTMHLRKNASKTAQNRPPNKKLIAKSARFEKNLARASGNTFQISRKLEQFFEQFLSSFAHIANEVCRTHARTGGYVAPVQHT